MAIQVERELLLTLASQVSTNPHLVESRLRTLAEQDVQQHKILGKEGGYHTVLLTDGRKVRLMEEDLPYINEPEISIEPHPWEDRRLAGIFAPMKDGQFARAVQSTAVPVDSLHNETATHPEPAKSKK